MEGLCVREGKLRKIKRQEEEMMGKRRGGTHATFHSKPTLLGSKYTSTANVHAYTHRLSKISSALGRGL